MSEKPEPKYTVTLTKAQLETVFDIFAESFIELDKAIEEADSEEKLLLLPYQSTYGVIYNEIESVLNTPPTH